MGTPPSDIPPRLARVPPFTAAALLLVGVATLWPLSSAPGVAGGWCLLCGEQGLADALRNVVLFLPVGMAAALELSSRGRAVLLGVLTSAAVETLQIWIPGRHASPGDLVFDSLGTLMGVAVVALASHWLRPPAGRRWAWSGGGWLLGVGIVALGGALLGRSFPEASDYWVRFGPELQGLERFRGEVVNARLGGEELVVGRIVPTAPARRALARGDTLTLAFTSPTTPERLAPVLGVFDGDRREILLVGLAGDGLHLRPRVRGAAWQLERPRLRFGLAVPATGREVSLRSWREAGGRCMATGGTRLCRMGFTVGDGWRLLLEPRRLSPLTRGIMGFLWVSLLLVPTGFWAPTGRGTWLSALGAATVLLVLPWLAGGGLLPTPWPQLGGALLGVWTGRAIRRGRPHRRMREPPRDG